MGIKPTVGLTSRALVIPISQRQDTIGPMARTVKDAAYILQAIAGMDPYDNYTSAIPFDEIPDYVAACDFRGLQGARIGIATNVLPTNPALQPVLDAFNAAVAVIEAAGATIVYNANYTGLAEYRNDSGVVNVLYGDFLADLPNLYLSQLSSNPNNVTSLAEVREFTQSYPEEEYPSRDTGVWDAALALGYDNTSPQFWAQYQRNLYYGGEGGVLGALERDNLSAIILPSPVSPGIPALVGSPVITVPLGFYPANTTTVYNPRGNLVARAPNFPFGISFLGRLWSEADLISYAYAFEQRTMVRNNVQPFIAPNIELDQVVGMDLTGVLGGNVTMGVG